MKGISENKCSRCGMFAVGDASLDHGGICTVCREDPDYGIDEALSSKLKVYAAAERAAHPDEPRITCAAEGCREWAREWWYFCSRECRDGYAEQQRA